MAESMHIHVEQGDSRYEELVEIAKKAMSSDESAIIVAKGINGMKPEVSPFCIMKRVAFYVAYDHEDFLIYSSNIDSNVKEKAIQNTVKNARITSIIPTLESLYEEGKMPAMPTVDEWMPDGDPMYVVTNVTGTNGAGVLYCDEVLHKIWEKVGNYFIIPSSIHELTIIPDEYGLPKEQLDFMVKQVNHSEVPEHDRLVDQAFFYNGNGLKEDWKNV